MTAQQYGEEELVRFGSLDRPALAPSLGQEHGSWKAGRAEPVDNSRWDASQARPGWVPPELPSSEQLSRRRGEGSRVDYPRHGWRGLLYRTARINAGPSAAELELRRTIERVAATFTGARHVLFVNPKGGAGKTTTCLGIAGTFGLHRGRGVIAFDNNPTRGTLGLRSQPDSHSRTVTDLIADLDMVSRVGDLSAYTRSQRDGHFEVLASDENPSLAVARGEADYTAVMGVLDTFYKLICVDTGNDVTAPVFTSAVSTADQLVVVTGASWDSAYSASWMLDHLEQHGGAALVPDAVTVVTLPRGRSGDLALIDDHFRARTRAVHHVPFDPALDAGAEIALDSLRPRTRQAWLDIAADIADGFTPATQRPLEAL